MYRYTAYGSNILATHPIPELIAVDGCADPDITIARRTRAMPAIARAAIPIALALGACRDATAPSIRGARIAFQRGEDTTYNIYEISPDGSAPQNLTAPLGGRNLHPSWSPDGRRLVFVSDHTPAGLYVMNADGSGVHALTKAGPGDSYPAWSPDGSRIAFTSTRGGESDIWIAAADGSNPVQVTSFGAEAPAWTPDSKAIAYSDLSIGAIGLVDLNARQRYQISFPPSGGVDQSPAWAPDGSALAFIRSTPTTTQHLYLLFAGDTTPKPITNFSVGSDWTPVWAPSGRQLIFVHDIDYDFDLYIIGADGTGLQPLTSGPGLDFRPSW